MILVLRVISWLAAVRQEWPGAGDPASAAGADGPQDQDPALLC
jgi:hypothetical protein